MTLQPVLDAPLPVVIHFFSIVPAFFMGAWLLLASVKGSPLHRAVGKIYFACLVITCIVTLFIRASFNSPQLDLGPHIRLGVIHLFIPLTAWGLYGTIRALRRRDIAAHRGIMIRLYLGALLIAGAFAFTPGRIMHQVVFGS